MTTTSPTTPTTDPAAILGAHVWGVVVDGGEEIPVLAQSADIARTVASALYVREEGKAPARVGKPRLWTTRDVASFVGKIDARMERVQWEGGAAPPQFMLDLREVLTRDVDGAPTLNVTVKPPTIRNYQIEPYLLRNLVAMARASMVLGNLMRLAVWMVICFWPQFVKLLWVYGWLRWEWPMDGQTLAIYAIAGGVWTLLALAATLPWAEHQFVLVPEDR